MSAMPQEDLVQADHSHPALGGNVAAGGAMLLWCFSGVCYATGARAIGAMPYLALTSAAGVLTIVLMRVIRGGSIVDLFRLPGRVIVAGFFGVAIYSILLVGALGSAPDVDLGHVLLLNYLWPIWIVLLGIWLLDTKVRPGLVIGGAILGFVGLFIARGSAGFLHRPASWRPHAMALTASVLWALYSVLLRRWKIPAERGGSTFHFLVCSVLSAMIATVHNQWHMAGLDARAIFWIFFGGIGPVGLAYYWWEIGIKRGSVHLIALLAYFIPIGSAALIGLFFREAMSPWLLAGAAMIAAGAWVGHRGTE